MSTLPTLPLPYIWRIQVKKQTFSANNQSKAVNRGQNTPFHTSRLPDHKSQTIYLIIYLLICLLRPLIKIVRWAKHESMYGCHAQQSLHLPSAEVHPCVHSSGETYEKRSAKSVLGLNGLEGKQVPRILKTRHARAFTHSLSKKKKKKRDCLCQQPAAGTDWVTKCYWGLTVNPVASDQRPTCGCDQQRDVVEARHTAVITGRLVSQVVCLFSPLNMVFVLNMALNMAISYFSYTNGMWPQ